MRQSVRYWIGVLLFLGSHLSLFAQTFDPENPAEPFLYNKLTVTASPMDAVSSLSGEGYYKEGTEVTLRSYARSAPYTFSHWEKDGEWYSDEASPTYTMGNDVVTFTACYEYSPESPDEPGNDDNRLYLVAEPLTACTFNVESGKSYPAGQTVSLRPTKVTSYDFLGWYNGENLVSEELNYSFSMPEGDMTLTARFEYNPGNPDEPDGDGPVVVSYTLTYMVDGEVYKTFTIEYGTTITAEAEPTKEGYTFSGWSEIPETMPARDVTVEGSFEKDAPLNIGDPYDQESFTQAEDEYFDEITYTRTYTGNWEALYIPFEITVDEAFLSSFEVAYINDVRSYDNDNNGEVDDMVMEAFKITSGTLRASYPYLIRAKNAGEATITVTDATLYATTAENMHSVNCSSVYMEYTVSGTYATMTADQLDGCYAMSKGGAWIEASSPSATLRPFRLYLSMESRDDSYLKVNLTALKAIRLKVDGEETTAIEHSEFRIQNSELIYDLQGRRVENPGKGVYIVNGKKVIYK